MKPERAFVAERALARHCPELLPGPPPDAALLALFGAGGERLAQLLPAALAPLAGMAGIEADAEPARLCSAADLAGEIGPLAANSLLAAGGLQAPLLFSIEAGAVLRIVDRAFGGRGEVPAQLPEQFPLSAELMIARLETVLVAAVAEALLPGWHDALTVTGRDASLAALAPFAAGSPLAVQRIAVTELAGARWCITLAMPLDAIAALLGADARPRRLAAAAPAPANPADAPYGGLPLTVSAVLVDMAMPFAALADLAPGQVLPVSVARAVPLRVGETTIAHGSVGALEERVAVQITQAF